MKILAFLGGEISNSLGNIYSQDIPIGRPRTSQYDVLIFFSSILTEYTDHKVVLIIKDDALPQSLVFSVDLSVTLHIAKP